MSLRVGLVSSALVVLLACHAGAPVSSSEESPLAEVPKPGRSDASTPSSSVAADASTSTDGSSDAAAVDAACGESLATWTPVAQSLTVSPPDENGVTRFDLAAGLAGLPTVNGMMLFVTFLHGAGAALPTTVAPDPLSSEAVPLVNAEITMMIRGRAVEYVAESGTITVLQADVSPPRLRVHLKDIRFVVRESDGQGGYFIATDCNWRYAVASAELDASAP